MPLKGIATTMCLIAWDTVNNVGKTGDQANIGIRGVGDGTLFTPTTATVTQLDATNLPGVYKFSLTASENNYTNVIVGGSSTTTGVAIQPVQWTNEASPLAAIVEGTLSVQDSLKLANAANAGKVDGGSTTTEHIRDVNDTLNRITATVDSSGNRTAITLNLT